MPDFSLSPLGDSPPSLCPHPDSECRPLLCDPPYIQVKKKNFNLVRARCQPEGGARLACPKKGTPGYVPPAPTPTQTLGKLGGRMVGEIVCAGRSPLRAYPCVPTVRSCQKTVFPPHEIAPTSLRCLAWAQKTPESLPRRGALSESSSVQWGRARGV